MSNKKLLSSQIPEIGRNLTKFTGKELIDRVGNDVINEVVTSILCGGNVRTLTEGLTQRRILISNASLFLTYLKGSKLFENFESNFNSIIINELTENKLKSEEKIFLQWFIGLTGKSIQNVLRSNPDEIEKHLREFDERLKESSVEIIKEIGDISTTITIDKRNYLLKWPSLLKIFYAIGTQTLAIRGSEKSMYGKLFEKLILGSVLQILGFKQIDPKTSNQSKMVFWLSQRENKRESDATILIKPGIGARFDLGFIGPGNSEISLDKVSRFEKEMSHGRQLHYMSTIILVDRIGDGSRITEMAKEINGTIIQMSMTYWVKEVAQILSEKLGFKHPILNMKADQSIEFIESEMKEVDLKKFMD
ncbi:MAG: CfrBI family restriction endonuclease [Bacteroidetes bacterium]|nr:CfrBI family restriction endonuclease [Bacteroidota bacterium]